MGGAGYIGSHAVYQLIDRGETSLSLTTSRPAKDRQYILMRSFMKGMCAIAISSARFRKERIEEVIHFAASSLVGESMKDPLKYYDNNVSGTQVCFRRCSSTM
ncbi:GDP-mannose 4,6-dehydratase [Bacillus licheniformis]|nr:GDP-mannose 4,6-dehydratase [Bacillus licheniformis]